MESNNQTATILNVTDTATQTATPGPQNQGQQGGTPEGQGQQVPEWAQPLLSKVDELSSKYDSRISDIGKQVANLRDRTKGSAQQTQQTSESGTDNGSSGHEDAPDPRAEARNETRSLIKLGEMKAKLPEGARADLDKMLDDGLSVAEVAARAELLSKYTASGTQPNPPRGHTGTAAPNSNGANPHTMQGLMKLRLRDPAEFERVTSSPDFEPPKH